MLFIFQFAEILELQHFHVSVLAKFSSTFLTVERHMLLHKQGRRVKFQFGGLAHYHSYLMVMIFECHLQIEAHELREMSVRVGIFGTEDSTHSEHLRDNDDAQGQNVDV